MKPLRLIFILPVILFFPYISFAQTINYQVPFVSQAPRGNWKDVVFKDACEETSLIMAEAWMLNQPLDPINVEARLHDAATWEVSRFGFHQDTGAYDTYILATEYFHLPATYQEDITTQNIIGSLADGNLVVVPVNASKLYKKGPPRHMIVITGFDEASGKFVYQDPMLSHGNNQTVSEVQLSLALRDYPSGIHLSVKDQRTAMIVIHWPWLNLPVR